MANEKQPGLLGGLLGKKSGPKTIGNRAAGMKPKIPRIAQDSVPYVEAYENGVLQVEPGVFTKTAKLTDISFKTKSEEEQYRMYEGYMKVLNNVLPKEDVFISVVNTKDDAQKKAASIIAPLAGDELDKYRKEMGKIIIDKMKSSSNNIRSDKYITIRTEANSVDEAMKKLDNTFDALSAEFKRITGEPLKALTLAERLEMLFKIMNGEEDNFWFEHDPRGNVSLDVTKMKKNGLTTRDIICPEFLQFNGNDFVINERYGQSMYLDGIANYLNTNFFTDISSMPFEGVLTLHISAIPQEDSIKLIHNQSVSIHGEAKEKMKKLSEKGYVGGEESLPTDLKNAIQQIEDLQQDLLNRDQKMFYISLTMAHFAENKEVLKQHTGMIKGTASKHMCKMQTMMMQQERGFTSALPVGIDRGYTKRLMTTESLGVFIPFDEANQFDKGGFYYGVNPINKSLIVYNRLKGQNYNGLILGSSGSGKSFSAKREMTNVILNTNSDIYIIDPDGEYSTIAEEFGGTVIKISPGNGVYLNPFDLDIDTSYDSDYNPITMKTDFICGMLETMIGGFAKLNPIQKALVDKCITKIYTPYITHLKSMPPDEHGRPITIDKKVCPTMQNLFEALLDTGRQEAQDLALVMEPYTNGTYNSFARKTSESINTDSRIVVYDIKNVGSNMMELALKVCINDVWLKMMDNRRKNKWTWFYIDEFHLLLANASTSEFLKSVWKRARKWQGVPTGITQNVEDLLESTEARAIINNSSFVYMMNQSTMDRNMLQELLSLTDADKEFITNAETGCGLIYTGKQSIPFADKFPQDTELYKIFSTNPNDDN